MADQEQESIILPPSEVFEITPNYEPDEVINQQQGTEAGGWIKTTCPETGGMYSHNEGKKYPRKGHPYPGAIIANNQVKRVILLIAAIASFVKPSGYLTRVVDAFNRFASAIYNSVVPIPYLKKQFYNSCSRELWGITERFLRALGVPQDIAIQTGRIIATVIEYDDAYRLRLEDIFSETSKEQLCGNPRKELTRLMEIYQSRELALGPDHIGGRMLMLTRVVKALLLIPRFKRAFVSGFGACDFAGLQLDETDRYYCLTRPDYKFFGQPIEQRYLQYVFLHPELIAPEGVKLFVKNN